MLLFIHMKILQDVVVTPRAIIKKITWKNPWCRWFTYIQQSFTGIYKTMLEPV